MRVLRSPSLLTLLVVAILHAAPQGGGWDENTRAASQLRRAGRYADAEPLYRAALDAAEREPDSRLRLVSSLNNLALLYKDMGRYDEAGRLAERGVSISQHMEALNIRVGILNTLGSIQQAQGRQAQAHQTLQQALFVGDALGPDQPEIVSALHNLAALAFEQEQYSRAERLYTKVLASRERALGADHPEVGLVLGNLAAVYVNVKRFDEAEALARRALAIRERALGRRHPSISVLLSTLGAIAADQGRLDEAEQDYREALDISHETRGADHPDVAMEANNLANLYLIQRRFRDAEPLLQKALAINERAFGPYHPRVAMTLETYAALLHKTGRGRDAVNLEARANEIRLGQRNRGVVDVQALRAAERRGQQ